MGFINGKCVNPDCTGRMTEWRNVKPTQHVVGFKTVVVVEGGKRGFVLGLRECNACHRIEIRHPSQGHLLFATEKDAWMACHVSGGDTITDMGTVETDDF